jgi:hypothetical protein
VRAPVHYHLHGLAQLHDLGRLQVFAADGYRLRIGPLYLPLLHGEV